MESWRAGAALAQIAMLAYLGGHGTPPENAPHVAAAPVRVVSRMCSEDEPAEPAVLDREVQPLLDRACAPCHSDERRDPWYAKLAPSSWSTTGARRALNFSEWPRYDDERRERAIGAVAAVVDAGTMPPADYTFFNRGAKLSADDKQLVVRWAAAAHP